MKECQSLVSPKTLLNGTAKPLGLSCATAPPPLGRCSLQGSGVDTHHFLPPSNTFGCLQTPLLHPAQTAAAGYLLFETDDRCGSYDDVVIEGGDEVAFEAEDRSDISDTLRGLVTSERSGRALIEQTAVNGSLMTTKSTKVLGHNVSMSSRSETRRYSLVSGLCPFAVQQGVSLHVGKNGHQYTGLDVSETLPAKTPSAGENSKKTKPLNASVQGKTTAASSCTLNEALITPCQGHRGPLKPFKIFNDNPSSSSSSRRPCGPTSALCSRPVNAPSARGGTVWQRTAQKVTSPLCSCGRRAKRQLVSNGGPNHGRGFYCCPVRRSPGGGQVQKGCEFFMWESAVIKSSSPASSSVSFCHFKSSHGVSPVQSWAQRKSF